MEAFSKKILVSESNLIISDSFFIEGKAFGHSSRQTNFAFLRETICEYNSLL